MRKNIMILKYWLILLWNQQIVLDINPEDLPATITRDNIVSWFVDITQPFPEYFREEYGDPLPDTSFDSETGGILSAFPSEGLVATDDNLWFSIEQQMATRPNVIGATFGFMSGSPLSPPVDSVEWLQLRGQTVYGMHSRYGRQTRDELRYSSAVPSEDVIVATRAQSVPEPSSIMFILCGITSLFYLRKQE